MKNKIKRSISFLLVFCLILCNALFIPNGNTETKNKKIKIVLSKKTLIYNSCVQYPKITVKYKGKKLPKKNYKITIDGLKNYPKNGASLYDLPQKPTSNQIKQYMIARPGKHTIKVTLKGKYKGKKLKGYKKISYSINLPNVKIMNKDNLNTSGLNGVENGQNLNSIFTINSLRKNNNQNIEFNDFTRPIFTGKVTLYNDDVPTLKSTGAGGFNNLHIRGKYGNLFLVSLQVEISTDNNFSNIVYSRVVNNEYEDLHGFKAATYSNEEWDNFQKIYFRENTTYFVRERYICTVNNNIYTSPKWSVYKFVTGSDSNIQLDSTCVSKIGYVRSNGMMQYDDNNYFIFPKNIEIEKKYINHSKKDIKHVRKDGDYCTFFRDENGKWFISYYNIVDKDGKELTYSHSYDETHRVEMTTEKYNEFINSFEETSLNYIIQRISREYFLRDDSSKSWFKKIITVPFEYQEPL